MSETLTLHVEIGETPLHDRRCNRCQGREFRELLHTRDSYQARCADCGYHGNGVTCGRIVSFVIRDTGETLVRCGDMLQTEFCTWDSSSAFPLAICMGCFKLVALQ